MIVAIPGLTAVIVPLAETVAIVTLLDDQFNEVLVTFVGLNVTVTACVLPISSVHEETDTVILSGSISRTVIWHFAVLLFEDVAVISHKPAFTAVTKPSAETVAIEVFDDVHVIVLSVALLGFTVACN